jgi:hypothetical protein
MAELDSELLTDAISAQGPDGLKQALEQLLERTKRDLLGPKEFIVIYQLGNQRSIIKIDFNQQPCHFWYQDLLGRPITKAVESTIAEFLWTKCGEKERYLKEISTKEST